MRVLIVFAHAEPTSFNGAMLHAGVAALTAAGHEVKVSDLYAMGFDPVSDRRNFVTIANPAELRQQTEEAHASANGGFVSDLQAEMDKLAWCDILVFQFPIWWLGLPAILKGWVDRVFAVGRAYGGGRWFEGGFFAGKRAMCAVSVGGLEDVYSEDGVYARIEDILFPIHRGIFAFTGFGVIEPFVVYGPGRISAAEREGYLRGYTERLLTLDTAPILVDEQRADRAGFRGNPVGKR
ncbi:NAD(P)H-dependent oxidoreductase [Sphingomonas sp. AR_OL41]|uniref:NAD(P)H-dependent oxidoreductase n=1 Tax=Sphingomonas sp. AR_OL41 TaxID=3042729 RepID=UPI00248137BB|nr:NAD(P)H-dependent oxidoreductase [Sphingomonas sp. AR_OL41]MDH7971602.1 NAD(P)H-dependent oxidoreductase [Sphingomonas sp. AR_OL41]